MPIPDVAFGIWLASETGGVQLLQPSTFSAIVPEADPKEYRSLCRYALFVAAVVIATGCPSSTEVLSKTGCVAGSDQLTVSVTADQTR